MACSSHSKTLEISSEEDKLSCSSSSSITGWLSDGDLEDLEPIATEKEVEKYQRESKSQVKKKNDN